MPCKSYLGQGASGQVRLAIRKSDGKKFAVKILEKSVMDARDYCFKELRIGTRGFDKMEFFNSTKNLPQNPSPSLTNAKTKTA